MNRPHRKSIKGNKDKTRGGKAVRGESNKEREKK